VRGGVATSRRSYASCSTAALLCPPLPARSIISTFCGTRSLSSSSLCLSVCTRRADLAELLAGAPGGSVGMCGRIARPRQEATEPGLDELVAIVPLLASVKLLEAARGN